MIYLIVFLAAYIFRWIAMQSVHRMNVNLLFNLELMQRKTMFNLISGYLHGTLKPFCLIIFIKVEFRNGSNSSKHLNAVYGLAFDVIFPMKLFKKCNVI